MDDNGKVVVVGTLLIANVLMFAFVWGAMGAWLLPWLMVFWHGPLVGGIIWVLGE